MYLETTDYFEKRRHQHGVTMAHVREALSNEAMLKWFYRPERLPRSILQSSGAAMKIEYFAKTDTLSILLLHDPGYVEGEDTNDPDVTLLYDRDNRVAEIVIEHASQRTDLDGIRRQIGFEEIADVASRS